MEKGALDWNDMQFLLVAADSTSMYEAAERLQVNRTTISRRIDNLEDALGVKLLARSGRGLALTEAGEEAVRSAEVMRGEIANLRRRVSGRDEQLAGTVRFTMPAVTSPGPMWTKVVIPDPAMALRLCEKRTGLTNCSARFSATSSTGAAVALA